jgi:hypothetical protein
MRREPIDGRGHTVTQRSLRLDKICARIPSIDELLRASRSAG